MKRMPYLEHSSSRILLENSVPLSVCRVPGATVSSHRKWIWGVGEAGRSAFGPEAARAAALHGPAGGQPASLPVLPACQCCQRASAASVPVLLVLHATAHCRCCLWRALAAPTTHRAAHANGALVRERPQPDAAGEQVNVGQHVLVLLRPRGSVVLVLPQHDQVALRRMETARAGSGTVRKRRCLPPQFEQVAGRSAPPPPPPPTSECWGVVPPGSAGREPQSPPAAWAGPSGWGRHASCRRDTGPPARGGQQRARDENKACAANWPGRPGHLPAAHSPRHTATAVLSTPPGGSSTSPR